MKRSFVTLAFTFLLVIPLLSQEDAEGCRDPALFTRMPNFHIYRCEDLQFDKLEFWVSSDKKEAVEGHMLMVNYYLNENAHRRVELVK